MTYCSSNRGNLQLIIDEVQRAPELISPIRWVVEQSDEKGRIVLSGSRAHHLMKGASESLAGRIRIVELPPLSLRVLGGRLRAAERYGRTMGGCRSVLAFRPRADAHRGGDEFSWLGDITPLALFALGTAVFSWRDLSV